MTTISSPARNWTIGGLLVIGAGLLAQQVAGVEMPVVPPGLVLVVVAAVLMLVTTWRWTPILALVAGAAEAAAVLVGAGKLVDFGALDVLGATWLRFAGIVVTLVAGVFALRTNYRKQSTATA